MITTQKWIVSIQQKYHLILYYSLFQCYFAKVILTNTLQLHLNIEVV